MFTYKDKKFYLDGKEFKIRSGSLHYFRAFPEQWESLMQKYAAAGLNCVETYIAWNVHEAKQGQFNFSGIADIERFIKTAEKVGLKVILRPGPFICAEWENGGLPTWLYKDGNMRLRCKSEPYLTHLKTWYGVLFSKIKPYLDANGGPVIAVALENEYGSFGDDFEYLSEVENIYKEAGLDCLFFSSDGDDEIFLCTGSHDHVIKAIDFACSDIDMDVHFAPTDKYLDGKAPYFAAEYWGGNYTHWGNDQCYTCSNEDFAKNMRQFVEMGASFNDYMFFGGTNFGFMNGANIFVNDFGYLGVPNVFHAKNPSALLPTMTSYDYDAALTEWGDYTEKFFIVRDLLEKENGAPLPPLPPEPEFQDIGEVELKCSASLFDNLQIAENYKSKTVESMEYFDQSYGYIRYRKTMAYDAPYDYIELDGIRDRAQVYINGELIGTRMRGFDESRITINGLKKGDVIDVFVENLGRVNFGISTYKGDYKGITNAILFSNRVMFDWDVSCFEMQDVSKVNYECGAAAKCPAFFKGEFKAEPNKECFVHMDNFTKGIVFVNGFNLGRFWDVGPQSALYIPGPLLKENNEIVVFESDAVKGKASVKITSQHGLKGKRPKYHRD